MCNSVTHSPTSAEIRKNLTILTLRCAKGGIQNEKCLKNHPDIPNEKAEK